MAKNRVNGRDLPRVFRLLLPLVIFDMHLHGRDFEQAYKTTIFQVLWEAIRSGIDISAIMPNSVPALTTSTMLKATIDKLVEAERELGLSYKQRIWIGLTDTNLDICESALDDDRVVGLKGYPLKKDGSSVTTGTCGVISGKTILDGMRLGKEKGKPNAYHCDDPYIISQRGNVIDAVVAYVEMILELASQVPGSRVVFCHVPCRRAAELIMQAQDLGMDMIIELCPQYLWFDNERTNWNPALDPFFYHCFNNLYGPKEREFLVSLLLEASKRMIIVSSDSACHLTSEKLHPDIKKRPGGIPSNQQLVNVLVTLAQMHNIPYETIGHLLSWNPSKAFNIPVPHVYRQVEFIVREDNIEYNNGLVTNPWAGSTLYAPVKPWL